jgi:FkbM family methyltransferase
MRITSKIRKILLDCFGLYLHEAKTMSVGTDYAVDLVHKIGLQPKTIFDVGANIGQTVDFYRNLYPRASIYSFEPIPKTFTKLQKNCSDKKDVHLFNIAFGDKKKLMKIQVMENQASVLNSLSNEFQAKLKRDMESYETVNITVETLDDFVEKNSISQINLLKIDTEGHEISVLKGAGKLLASGRVSAIICEGGFMRSNKRNTYFGDVNEILEDHGYALFGIYEMGHLGFKKGKHYGNLLYLSKNYRENTYKNWQIGY